MRALTLDFDTHTLRARDIPTPQVAAPDEVLLRVREVGVCGTDRDLAAFQFGRPPAGSPYLVLGHEALAEVIGTGQLVVPMVRHACHPPCAQCARGRRDLCLTGRFSERGIFGAHGYFAEFAVDQTSDLVAIPASVAQFAVLTEPLSVVEKAVATALRLHAGEPSIALVLGAGTIGILAAMLLRLRGLDVDVCSVESATSPRARLVQQAGAQFVNKPCRQADIVIEAAGAPEAARTGLESLAPLGVLMILGAARLPESVPLLPLIVGNQVIAGSVNAGPEAFRAGVDDLARMPRAVLGAMIEHLPFSEFPRSLAGAAGAAPKFVHVID